MFQQFWKGVAESPLGDLVTTRIRNKLALGMLAVGLSPLFVLGLALYHASASMLEPQEMFTMWKVFLIVAVGASVLILIVSLMIATGLTRQSEAIMEMLSAIGVGDFTARTEIVCRDELGTVAKSLNSMCDNTLSLIQSREERDAIQSDIQILMEEVSEIANGDLTIQSNVNRDVTGGIADAINFMISQLRDVVRRVKRATEQVTRSAHLIFVRRPSTFRAVRKPRRPRFWILLPRLMKCRCRSVKWPTIPMNPQWWLAKPANVPTRERKRCRTRSKA